MFKPMVLCMQTHVHKTMVLAHGLCMLQAHGETYKSLLLGLCKAGLKMSYHLKL